MPPGRPVALLGANIAIFLLQDQMGPQLVAAVRALAAGHPGRARVRALAAGDLRLPARRPHAPVLQHAGAVHVRPGHRAPVRHALFPLYYFGCIVSAALVHLAVTAWMGARAGADGGRLGRDVRPAARLRLVLSAAARDADLSADPDAGARVRRSSTARSNWCSGVTGTASGVAHFAHLGGMLGGWLMLQYRRGGFPFR